MLINTNPIAVDFDSLEVGDTIHFNGLNFFVEYVSDNMQIFDGILIIDGHAMPDDSGDDVGAIFKFSPAVFGFGDRLVRKATIAPAYPWDFEEDFSKYLK